MFRAGAARGGPRSRRETARALDVMEEVLREAGAGLAGRLTALTAPLSKGQGEKAVARDITTLFGGRTRVQRILREESPRKAGAWAAAIEKGAGAGRLRRILAGTSLAGTPILSRPDEEMHRKFLRKSRKRRRERRLPKAIVYKRKAVDRFMARNLEEVGTARLGWKQAAEELGSTGGAWAARKGGRLGGARVERSGTRVSVVLYNRVRYARFLMSPSRRRKLIEEARVKAARRVGERYREGR